jgi:hypothetical protein
MPSVTVNASACVLNPQLRDALQVCVNTLGHLSPLELDPPLNRRMLDLGERKESLTESEYEELLSLISLSERRTREKREAELALRRLQEVVPELRAS